MSNPPHMTLEAWMRANGETLESFADKAETTSATVSRWRSGQSFPRRDALDRIFRLTGGRVTASSFHAPARAS